MPTTDIIIQVVQQSAVSVPIQIVAGSPGPSGTLSIGTTTTGAPGTSASVTNVGTPSAAVFNFTIPRGADGAAATVSIGSTTTGAAGSNASVTNSGTSAAAVFNFTIPRGADGTPATVSIGTVTTGAAGSSATVTNVGSGSAAVLNFTIPRGDTGAPGSLAWADITGKPSTFPPSTHTHAISDVTSLQTSLDGKAALSHTHAISDVTGLQVAIDGKAALSHTHAISDVTGLQTALDGKALSIHSHAISDVTGLQTALDGKAATSHTHTASQISDSTTAGRALLTAADVTAQRTTLSINNVDNTSDANKPISTATQTALNGKANTSHTHAIADVTGLQTALDGKQPAGAYAASAHTHGITDVTGLQTALDGKAATVHTHAIADVTGLQTLLNDANGTPLNQAIIRLVRKASAGTITKGQVVYVVGSQGTHLTVELADADNETTSSTTIGVAMGDITSTVENYIIVQGMLEGLTNLPTASFADGAALWLSSTSGGWTTTRPTQPAHGVALGWVVAGSNGSSGRAYIKITNGQELEELHDVLITSPANDQVLTYDSSTGLWKNKTPSSSGGGITNGQSIVNALIFG